MFIPFLYASILIMIINIKARLLQLYYASEHFDNDYQYQLAGAENCHLWTNFVTRPIPESFRPLAAASCTFPVTKNVTFADELHMCK